MTGAGVILAQRLEQLAEPSGVVVQGAVSETVPTRLPFEFKTLGEQSLKGFDEPVRAFAVCLIPGENVPVPEAASPATVGSGIVTVAEERSLSGLSDKPSIAVLPFANLSRDPAQDALCDGISEDIITGLSKIPSILVVSRSSTFRYKETNPPMRQLAKELGVRYVLEGSLQSAAGRVRITAQLIDGVEDRHAWAERYDRNLEDVFALQDDITLNVVAALEVSLTEGDKATLRRKQTDNVDAYLAHRRGLELMRGHLREDEPEAHRLLEQAIDTDPGFATAWVDLGWLYYHRVQHGWVDDAETALREAERFAHKGVELDPTEVDGLVLLAQISILRRDYEKAAACCDKALAFGTNDAVALASCAGSLYWLGRHEEALTIMERAMRLAPYAPDHFLHILGRIYYQAGWHREAIEVFDRLRARRPGWEDCDAFIATIAGEAGYEDIAKAAVTRLTRMNPGASVHY